MNFSKMPILDQADSTGQHSEPALRAAPVASGSGPGGGANEDPNGLEVPAWRHFEPAADSVASQIVAALRDIYDPEIPVNIYDLGLIYKVESENDGKNVRITMTLTSPMCPVAESLPPEVEQRVQSIEGVSQANVEIVWEPTWNPDMMSEAAKLQLNMF